MSKCISCECQTNKYKCPRCYGYYCSLPCYKAHSEKPCESPVEEKATEEKEFERRTHMPFKTDDTVDIEKLEALEHSEGLRNLLYNPHLRELLKEVDSAPSAWKAMRAAMLEPLFVEFADECMKVVEPMDDIEET